MRKKINGYILQFTRADHGGRHIHVFRDNDDLGVYDRTDGPVRGLERHWNHALEDAVRQFLEQLNERGM